MKTEFAEGVSPINTAEMLRALPVEAARLQRRG
jgi:hypothetical protein